MIKEKFNCERGGLRISGVVYRGKGEKLPIGIICHGFLANQNMCSKYAKVFAEMGYAAFTFDFIGGSIKGKSEGKLSDMSVLTEAEDLEAVIEYAKGLGYTDGGRVTLMGCSQGGFVSALEAVKLRPDKLILFYPALCIPDDARKGKMMMFEFKPHDIPEEIPAKVPFLKLGAIYPKAVIEMDPYKEISGYNGKVLIIHGNADGIVNISYSKKAEEAYRESGAECRLIEIEGGGHGFDKKHDKTAIAELKKFLME